MTTAFQDLPIKRKLTVAILGTALVVLLAACTTFVAYEVWTFRESMTGKIVALADVLATDSTAALQFRNQDDAAITLNALAADPEIVSACLYSAEGEYFAGYAPKQIVGRFPGRPRSDGEYFEHHRLLLFRPVTLDSKRIGTIYIEATLDELTARLRSYISISLLILGGSSLLALALASSLQRLISNPILTLAGTAKSVSERNDYSVRARKVHNDELGFLTDSFNRMLADIEERTAALQHANESMQSEIAERKRAEETIREQAALLDLAQDSIYLEELDGGIRYWNRSAAKLYGWSAQEVRGKQGRDFLFPTDKPEPAQARSTFMETGEWVGEKTQVTHAGTEIVVESRWTLIRDGAGAPKAILHVNSNITERKKLESQLLRAQRLDSIGRLAGGIAHDLNNLLAPILMGVSLLREEVKSECGVSFLEMIQASAQRGADILKHVLTFARGVGGDRARIQVRHLVKEMSDFIRETFPRNITFASRIVPDIPPIQGDATQIHQVLMNLCVNSRDAMPDGGRLSIDVDRMEIGPDHKAAAAGFKPGLYVAIAVNDTGIGIPPACMDKIFDPFFTTKEQGRGTGLGLSIAFGIVKSHGGSITVESTPGKGTLVEVLLPAAKADVEERPADAPAAPKGGSGELVLIVDDEPAICHLSATILQNKGYRVLTAKDGADATEVYKAHSSEVALVLTDVIMPRVDGVELVRAIKAMAPSARILASTGQAEESRQKDLRALGVVSFLKKPYTAQQLLKSVYEAIRTR